MAPVSFSEVVVAASGNIPGRTHDHIKAMVEECGARFETLSLSECTHIISTRRNVESGKIRALAASSCEVVSIEWLVDSIRDNRPLSTDKYLLRPAEGNAPITQLDNLQARPEGNKRKLEEDDELSLEPLKIQKNNMHVYQERLRALVDKKFVPMEIYPSGIGYAVWMDEDDVQWNATLVSNLSLNPAAGMNAGEPTYQASIYILQILYNFRTGEFCTWFRFLGDNISRETVPDGIRYGPVDLEGAQREFKRLFQEVARLSWEERLSLSFPLLDWDVGGPRCVFIQPQSQEEKDIVARSAELPKDISKLRGVRTMLNTLFGHTTRRMMGSFFDEVARSRINTVILSRLSEQRLEAAVATLEQLKAHLTQPSTMMGTQAADIFQESMARYLKECYFALLGVANRSISNPEPTNLDWVTEELANVQLLLLICSTLNTINPYMNYLRLPSSVMQQVFQALGLAEIKQVAKKTRECNGLEQYLRSAVGRGHTVHYKEIVNIFRIQRHGEVERYNHWREANKDKIGQKLLLWHGSGCDKFVGILNQGLRVGLLNKSTGGMFGAGIYFADMSGKSARYCGDPGSDAFMLLCEVEIGRDPLRRFNSDRNAEQTLINEGKLGVVAEGRLKHKAWMKGKAIHRSLDDIWVPDVSKGKDVGANPNLCHNEYVVYNPAQIRQRYLFHLKI